MRITLNIIIVIMIIVIMIDRDRELCILKEVYDSPKAELVLLYGRRRVGKSRLLVESIKDRKDAQYFLCDMSNNVLDILAKQVTVQFVRFGSWDDFFEYVIRGPHRIVIIDEFQYLALIDSAWPTILQRWWERLKETDRKVVLCGSILSTIYRISTGVSRSMMRMRSRTVRYLGSVLAEMCVRSEISLNRRLPARMAVIMEM